MNALVRRVVSVMSVRHKLSEEEEYAYVLEVLSAKGLKLNGKKVPMPLHMGVKLECCKALEKNHGLYTQCERKTKGVDYCGTCAKKMEKKGLDRPEFGRVEDRFACGVLEYVSHGEKVKSYVSVLRKLKFDPDAVRVEAERLCIEIDAVHWVEDIPDPDPVPPKGKKTTTKVKEVKVKEPKTKEPKTKEPKTKEPKTKEPKEPKEKKGRPRKAKVSVEVHESPEEEVIVPEPEPEPEPEPVVDAKKQKAEEAKKKREAKKTKKSKKEEDEEEEDVTTFNYQGQKYLRSDSGIIYDYKTYKMEGDAVVLGHWDESNKKIVFDANESDEESEEEYDD